VASRIENGLELTGRVVGKAFVEPSLRLARERTKSFQVYLRGVEVLQQFKDRPFLIAANHIKPTNSIALSPDAFIIKQIILEETGQKIRTVSSSDISWQATNGILQSLSHRFTRGVVKGAGEVPTYRDSNSMNRNLLSEIARVVAKGDSVLIFPQGEWFNDFDPTRKFHNGAARMAIQEDLPIIPLYIHGCNSWQKRTRVELVFGEPIDPMGKSVSEITDLIRERVTNAQMQFKSHL
jgi:1-acyl-sn-glycerol-3-phosphate acyltransferase